jgi:hypothetical protein
VTQCCWRNVTFCSLLASITRWLQRPCPSSRFCCLLRFCCSLSPSALLCCRRHDRAPHCLTSLTLHCRAIRSLFLRCLCARAPSSIWANWMPPSTTSSRFGWFWSCSNIQDPFVCCFVVCLILCTLACFWLTHSSALEQCLKVDPEHAECTAALADQQRFKVSSTRTVCDGFRSGSTDVHCRELMHLFRGDSIHFFVDPSLSALCRPSESSTRVC